MKARKANKTVSKRKPQKPTFLVADPSPTFDDVEPSRGRNKDGTPVCTVRSGPCECGKFH